MNLGNAIIDGVKTMKDGSLKITLLTRELSPTQMAELFHSLNKEVLSVEIPEGIETTKSPAKRLRDVLYVLWRERMKSTFDSSEVHYAHCMEQIIDHYKNKIND